MSALMLLALSCVSKKNNEIYYDAEVINFPEFPYFETAIIEDDGTVTFSWRDKTGNVPAEWFYALAQYQNTISAIEYYLKEVNKIGN